MIDNSYIIQVFLFYQFMSKQIQAIQSFLDLSKQYSYGTYPQLKTLIIVSINFFTLCAKIIKAAGFNLRL